MADQQRESAFARQLFERIGLVPGDIQSRERPDLSFRVNDMEVGMEITESTASEIHWGAQIAEALDTNPAKPVFYTTSHLRNYGRRRTRKELFHDMFNNPEYVDMSAERQRWCEDVRSQWARKRDKLRQESFTKFDENWLLIWDNKGLNDDYSTLTSVQREVLRTPFFSDADSEFDHIYVLSGNYTFDFIPGKVAFHHTKAAEMNAWINKE